MHPFDIFTARDMMRGAGADSLQLSAPGSMLRLSAFGLNWNRAWLPQQDNRDSNAGHTPIEEAFRK